MLLKANTVFALQASRPMAEPAVRGRQIAVREKSYSEEQITPESAITSSAVISIITLQSQDLASMPLLFYARKGRNKFRAFDNPYYALMHDRPNSEMSSMTFRELIVAHIIAWGNFFAQKIWNERGVVTELWPLRPDRMRVERVDGQKVYIYTPISGGKPIVFTQEEILHIPGFGFDGMVGYSKIALARNAIGLAVSMEKFGSKFFSNNASVGLIYKHPGTLGDTAYAHLNESLKEREGVNQSHKPIILEEGMSIDKLGIPPDDAQFLESRKFQLAEINRIVGPVPPHLIGDLEKSTSWGTGIDSQEQGYVNHSLFPIATRIEQGLNNQLLLDSDRAQGFFYEHLFDGLLRGDIQTRYESYVKAITNGFMSRNEARIRENLNPRPGLDAMLHPTNMTEDGDAQTDPQPQNALAPLYREAVNRVVKREMQDLQGAQRRHLAKGQTDEWQTWLDQFYGVDQPAFIQKQFQALFEAQQSLFGTASEPVNAYFTDYLAQRREYVSRMSSETLEADIELCARDLPDEMTFSILSLLEVPYGEE